MIKLGYNDSMRKLFLFLFITILLLPQMALAEEIFSFTTKIDVWEDSKLLVTERIVYDFGDEQRHGIYREIPYKYKARGGNYNLDIKVLSVTNDEGGDWDYETSRSSGNLKIKIGDADKLVTGKKNYVINYEVGGALNFFDEHDELYWNVTGNDWPVPILYAKADINLPAKADNEKLQTKCFTGVLGSTQENCGIVKNQKQILFQANNLAIGEGLTVVVGWPKGIVKEPSAASKVWKTIKDNLILLLPLVVFIFLYSYWKKHGRDPKGNETVVPEYEPPEGIKPAEAGVVIDEKMDAKDLTAIIIDLARRGYLKIKEIDKKILGISSGNDFEIINLRKEEASLNSYERSLFNALFDDGVKNEIKLSGLKSKSKVSREIKEIKKSIYSRVSKKGWFESNPEKIRAKFLGIGMAVLAFIFFFSGVLSSFSIMAVIAVLLSAVLFIVFSFIMPKKTLEGVEMKRRLDGFKMFLSVTEKDRVKFHFSPSANPEKFAEYLPWAIIFGVEKEWADVFKGIDMQAPDWYEGNWGAGYNALVLSNSLKSFDSSFSKSMVAAGGGAARGMSGFSSGGGFSGGGFGGGGGGSW